MCKQYQLAMPQTRNKSNFLVQRDHATKLPIGNFEWRWWFLSSKLDARLVKSSATCEVKQATLLHNKNKVERSKIAGSLVLAFAALPVLTSLLLCI